MAPKRGKVCALVVLLFLQSHRASSYFNDCGVKLDAVDVNSAESPIVLKYHRDSMPYSLGRKPTYSVEIFHPGYTDVGCLVRNIWIGVGLVSFACINHHLRFPGLENWPDNVSATSLIGAHQGTAFDNYTVIAPEHSSPISFEEMSGSVKCTGPVEPTMKKLSDGKYQIGYQMNAIDFLPVFDLAFTDQLTVAHAKLLSIINRRPRIHENNEILRKGQIFKDLPVAASQLSDKSQLSLKFKEILKSKYSTDNTIADNYLVHGQLLSKDDLFYVPEQRATFFFENTALMWNSINEGNWKMVGEVIRKLAYETATDLDVYSGTLECLTVDKMPISLFNSNNSTRNICVPKFLFKIALDKRYDQQRGIIFITVNDPTVRVDDDGFIASNYKFCDKKPECDQLYPEFASAKKGYTYCCDIENFIPWNEIKNVEQETKDNNVPIYSFPPPPPPPLPPMAAMPSKPPRPTYLTTV